MALRTEVFISPLPEAEDSAQHDGAATPAEIPEALQNPAAASAQAPGAAAGAREGGEKLQDMDE